MTKLRTRLSRLTKVISDKAEHDPHFAEQIEIALGVMSVESKQNKSKRPKRPGGRRAAAILDPVQMARNDPDHLVNELSELDIERLKDIVAEYGMDQSKLVMKWRNPKKIADHIVKVSLSRANKGHAFRSE